MKMSVKFLNVMCVPLTVTLAALMAKGFGELGKIVDPNCC